MCLCFLHRLKLLSTILQFYHSASPAFYESIILPSSTMLPLDHSTKLPFHHPAILPIYQSTSIILPFYNLAIHKMIGSSPRYTICPPGCDEVSGDGGLARFASLATFSNCVSFGSSVSFARCATFASCASSASFKLRDFREAR